MKLVVFDWDGTLMDSAAHIVASAQYAAKEIGLPEAEDDAIRNVIGLGLQEALAHAFPGIDREQANRFTAVYRERFISGQPNATALFPGVREVLDELRTRGFLLAVATGKGRNGLNRELGATGLEDMFAATRCADETASKPHPQMLLEILEETDIEPGMALMVGDTEYDLEMAASAKVAAVGVSWGVHDVNRLRTFSPLDVVRSPKHLLGFFDRFPDPR